MIQKIIRKKYTIVTLTFLVWMLFFDRNSMIEQYRQKQEVNELREASNYFIKQIETSRRERDELFTDVKALEKFGREKYLMKKDNEDVFVIIKEED